MAFEHPYPVPAVSTEQGKVAPGANVVSRIPTPPTKLDAEERKIWKHATEALHECGMMYPTASLALTVICSTYVRWVQTEKKLKQYMDEHDGSYIVRTPNGYEQPHQLFYVARMLKRELLQWLPEASLTIPSFQKAVGQVSGPQQGSLFEDDPVAQHRQRKTAIGLRVV